MKIQLCGIAFPSSPESAKTQAGIQERIRVFNSLEADLQADLTNYREQSIETLALGFVETGKTLARRQVQLLIDELALRKELEAVLSIAETEAKAANAVRIDVVRAQLRKIRDSTVAEPEAIAA